MSLTSLVYRRPKGFWELSFISRLFSSGTVKRGTTAPMVLYGAGAWLNAPLEGFVRLDRQQLSAQSLGRKASKQARALRMGHERHSRSPIRRWNHGTDGRSSQ